MKGMRKIWKLGRRIHFFWQQTSSNLPASCFHPNMRREGINPQPRSPRMVQPSRPLPGRPSSCPTTGWPLNYGLNFACHCPTNGWQQKHKKSKHARELVRRNKSKGKTRTKLGKAKKGHAEDRQTGGNDSTLAHLLQKDVQLLWSWVNKPKNREYIVILLLSPVNSLLLI